MRLYAVKTPIVKAGDNLSESILKSLRNQDLQLEDNDVLALTSKIVSFSEQRITRLSAVKPSERGEELAKLYSLKPEFAELVICEAERIYGGVEKAILTLKNGVLTANAGIDNKNTPADYAVLWPSNPRRSAKEIRDQIRKKTGKSVAVLIVDSGLVPLRIGTTGLALAVAGFKPIRDNRGDKDLFGKPIMITRHAVADDLASAAHLLMGEAIERTPVVLIKDAPVDFDDGVYDSTDMMMPFRECIFMNTFQRQLQDEEKG
jgi:coenzyme F420-0:L-glutamate ligase